jgi:hypothetical protein
MTFLSSTDVTHAYRSPDGIVPARIALMASAPSPGWRDHANLGSEPISLRTPQLHLRNVGSAGLPTSLA